MDCRFNSCHEDLAKYTKGETTMSVATAELMDLFGGLDTGTLVFDVDDLSPENVEVFDDNDRHIGFINMINMEFVPS